MTGQQLKNSILQLAVQGKLVPQDPTDEPASVLLARIREEKEQLIREKKIKREKNPSEIFRGDDGHFYERVGKNEPVCIDEELPFEIPETWEWARLGTVAQKITDGTHHSPANDENGDFLYITAKNIKDTGVILNPITYVSKEIHEKIYERCNPEFGDVLLIKDGATTGVVTVNNLDQPFSLLSSVALIKLPQDILSWYLVYALRSDLFYKIIRENMKGTGIILITLKQIEPLFIPLPPLAEQQRIVAKIEDLLPFVERYEQTENKLEKLNTTFPDQLKKSILQEAIQGKLVPQDPTDEPASALLERIRAEKDQLTRDGKIKREKNPSQIFRGEDGHFYERIGKNEPVCIDEELPFEIPESWEWCKLGEVCTIARGGSPRPIKDYLTTAEDGVNWIKIGDTDKNGKYIYSTAEKIKPSGVSKSRLVHSGDFLLTNSMSFGRPYILKTDGCIHDGWLVISQLNKTFDQDYLYWMLSSGYAYTQFCGKVSGAVVKNLNSAKVANSLFPLPPLAEQQRIVDKIEQLDTYINQLPHI